MTSFQYKCITQIYQIIARTEVKITHIAHINQQGDTQSVRDHCYGCAAYAAQALKSVGLARTAFLAGLLHDTGKAKTAFSEFICDATSGRDVVRGSVNHTFAAVRYILEHWHKAGGEFDFSDVTAELLAFAVGSHHGLFDCIDRHQNSGFFHRQTKEGIGYEEAVQNFLCECADEAALDALFRQAVQETTPIIEKISQLSLQEADEAANTETSFYTGLLARLLLSAVIEGDRRDTAEFMDGFVFPSWPEDMRPIWQTRLSFLEQKLSGFSSTKPIDRARQTISNRCAAFAAQPSGVYRLNVPTGGGKTLSGLRFALAHAAKWNKSRILFTAPLLSILDQNANVIREYVGDDSLILEHHSNLAEPEDTPERLRELALLTDCWESPIIITTLVQLLNTCFDGKTSAVRRFHALCHSIIVIDEVQTVPSKMLTLFNLAVNFLSEICGATIVLCSATQPALENACHPLCKMPVDIVPHDRALWEIFKRTEIQDAGSARLESLPQLIEDTLEECSSLLVVCNTKAAASFLVAQLQDTACICFHLSAAMCVAHRRKTLHDLQASLDDLEKGGQKVVCVSTQVIEAGVDISFQRVIRLSAGMDSIVQAAGRCNRHAEQRSPAPVRIVTCTDEKLRHLEDISLGQTATTSLLEAFRRQPQRFCSDLSSEESIQFYYRKLYSEMNSDYQDDMTQEHGSIYHLLADNPKYADSNCKQVDRYFLHQAFQLAGKFFHVFDENTVAVLVPYGEGKALREALIQASQGYEKDWAAIRKLLDKAKEYSVSLYRYQMEQLQSFEAVTGLFDNSIYVLSDGFYNNQTGFSIQNGLTGYQGV